MYFTLLKLWKTSLTYALFFYIREHENVICRILALIGFKVEEKYPCSFSLSLYVCMRMPVSVCFSLSISLPLNNKKWGKLNVIWHPRWNPGTKEVH